MKKTRKEELRELKAEKSRNLRWRKPMLEDLGYYSIRQGLEEISEACYDVEWLFDNDNEDFIYEALEEAYEDYDEFKDAFLMIRLDAEELQERFEEMCRDQYPYDNDIEEYYNDFTVALIGNRYNLLGFDEFQQDYYSLFEYEKGIAVAEAGKRVMRCTKADMLARIGQCMGIAFSYYDLRQRYDYLKNTFDMLRGENVSVIQVIRKIEEAYEKVNSEEFDKYSKETKEFDKLVSQLPEKVWIS